MDITPVRFTPPPPSQSPAQQEQAAPIDTPHDAVTKPVDGAAEAQLADFQNQSEQARYDAVEKAAKLLQHAFTEFNNSTFVIFKNNAGELITRITNHQDGTVRYLPEQSILQYVTGRQIPSEAVLALQV